MVDMILICLIVGDGGVLVCKIEGGRHVHFLKEEILKKKFYNFSADQLNLYLAKKNGDFLSCQDAVLAELSKGYCTPKVEYSYMNAKSLMHPAQELQDIFDQNVPKKNVIHVLVQLPAYACKRRKVREDITHLYAAKLRDVDMSALNTPKKLEAFISTPLPIKYPTDEKRLIDECPQFFEYSEDKFIQANVFENALRRRFMFSASKNANVLWWDMLIRTPIEETAFLMEISIEVGRNQTEKSTTSHSKPPDFVLWLHDVLVMKGEEKGSPGELVAAKGELVAMGKIHLSMFGKMPFLFTYAAANSRVQFLVIDRSFNVLPVSEPFDLKFLQYRIRCIVSAINIFRILYHYKSLLPEGFLPMYKKMPRNNGSVTLYADHLLKVLDHDPYDFESVMAIYDAIGRNEIQCTVRCDYRYERTLKLRPVGFTKLPTNDSELIPALICIARALVGLHALGYVHRDIRWPNILCLGDDSYILADLENAGRDGDPMPDDLLESRVLDPLVKCEAYGHAYRSCHDMYQFGELLAYARDPSLERFQKNLQRKNAEERYTAEGALKFLSNLHRRVQDDRPNAIEQ
ncbi:unnamed protein product [Albugo candida]|uniref:Crinkler effector protein N-terminal domain-containing protein n=1 Tax=Albugo candida TaxID=65357 RepID=A0A024GJN3_9STRA|nr:unnamed protein product [Albugo candida]|eukprot:CCI47105.1 unnamed protein product [Albugo candida]